MKRSPAAVTIPKRRLRTRPGTSHKSPSLDPARAIPNRCRRHLQGRERRITDSCCSQQHEVRGRKSSRHFAQVFWPGLPSIAALAAAFQRRHPRRRARRHLRTRGLHQSLRAPPSNGTQFRPIVSLTIRSSGSILPEYCIMFWGSVVGRLRWVSVVLLVLAAVLVSTVPRWILPKPPLTSRMLR